MSSETSSGSGAHRFGALALERGLISPAQLEQALTTQRHEHGDTQLGEVLVGLGLLSPDDVAELLRLQAGRRGEGPTSDPLVGETLGGCLILSPLGRGVSGTTYRARHLSLERDVAVKVLDPTLAADPQAVTRFVREARTVGRLEHPNLVTVHDLGQEHGRRFIVMQWVDGTDLATRLARGPLEVVDALRIALQVARALRAAHQVGVVHRDLKPANVLLARNGRVKLTDFGLARAPGTEPEREGEVVGTPLYMSPEQALGGAVGPAADQYALGAVLFHALSGGVPFPGQKVLDVLRQHLSAAPPGLGEVPPAVAALVARLLAKAPADRFPSDDALVEALKALLDEFGPGETSSDELAPLPSASAFAARSVRDERPSARAHLEALVVKVLTDDVAGALTDLTQLGDELAAPLAEQIFATLARLGRLDELANLGALAARWPRAQVHVARALNALHRPEEALEQLPAGDSLDPDVLSERVLANLALGRRGDAIRALEAAAAHPQPDLLRRVADLLAGRLDDLAGAAAVLGRLATLEPHTSRARREQARLLLEDDRSEHAQIALEDAVDREPDDAGAWALLGQARQRLGDAAGAALAYRTAVGLQPERVAARTQLCQLLVADGRAAEASALAADGLRLDPEHPDLLALATGDRPGRG